MSLPSASLLICGCLLLGLALTAAGQDQTNPATDARCREVIEKALAALGGAKQVAMFPGGTWKGEGIYYGFGPPATFNITGARQGAEQLSLTSISEFNGVKFVYAIVVNGDRGWVNSNGSVEEMTKEMLAAQKEHLYANWVGTIMPLLGPGFELEFLGGGKIGEQAVVEIKVVHKDHPAIKLSFGKETGLPVGRESVAKAAQGGQEKNHTERVVFGDYKAINGANHATKVEVFVDGKLFSETKITEHQPAEKLDDAVFAKPNGR